MFAWWPWRKPSPVEHRHDSGALSAFTSAEGVSHPALEGTTPQASATGPGGTTSSPSSTSRLSTIEEHPTYTAQNSSHTNEDPAAPLPLSNPAGQQAPTPQQRLEFLRYLVREGIVNEGKEEK
jgi:hypothetical protein